MLPPDPEVGTRTGLGLLQEHRAHGRTTRIDLLATCEAWPTSGFRPPSETPKELLCSAAWGSLTVDGVPRGVSLP